MSPEKISLRWDENYQMVITSGKHEVIINRPPDESEDDDHVGPIDLFLTGLGACIMSVTASFLQRRGVPFHKLQAEISWDYLEDPYRIGNISINLNLPADLEHKICVALEKVTRSCTVHNTLTHPPEIDVAVKACL